MEMFHMWGLATLLCNLFISAMTAVPSIAARAVTWQERIPSENK